ncbi:MAG: RdgB/HAM1 family non-canonical purine NTP pyrophosphatase [Flavobacteriaceae bacterium]|jgi:XTP/dITP diphosphohydrolase|nr:RdgB/HAM1 family non-canonical purine NTP pyrophosphatase [Flavobacteriaceae bacterium]
MQLLIATHNEHKKEEIRQILGKNFVVKSLTDYGIFDEIAENGKTFKENAEIKAKYCFEKTGIPSLGDDSGLAVEALNGKPGIFSARYADDHDFVKNIEKVLDEMKSIENRKAYFITVLCYYDESGAKFFEGKVHGNLLTENKGFKGFGYDPIFVPDGYEKTFAEMPSEEKNQISHRKKAIEKFLEFLEK